jgi:hypothetical protein
MKRLAQFLSWMALLGSVLVSFLFFTDRIALEQVKQALFFLALLWFLATPVWMEHSSSD